MIDTNDTLGVDAIGRYRVLRALGAGASSSVYLAEGPNSVRRVALRVARDRSRPDHEWLEAFLHQAELVATVSHPNVVAAYGVEEDPVLGPFLVTEFIDGLDLAEAIRRGVLDDETRLGIVVQIIGALHGAHSAGVVHGHLRPSKIIVSREGVVKVVGFGVPEPTSPSIGLGWAYVAPELLGGSEPTDASDRYSLAVIALELVTGRLPEQGLDGLDPRFSSVFERALRRDPGDRYPDGASFGRALVESAAVSAAARGRMLAALPPPTVFRSEAPGGPIRRPFALALTGACAAWAVAMVTPELLPLVEEPPPVRMLSVSSVPPGADVLVDGEPLGLTPRRLVARSDARRVRIERDGFEPIDVTLRGLLRERVEVEMKRESVPVRLVRATDPPPPVSRRRRVEAPPEPEASGLIPYLAERLRLR